MDEADWKGVCDSLLERISQLSLEHAAMKNLAKKLERERDAYKKMVEDNNAQNENNVENSLPKASNNGHGHGHTEIRVATPDN